MLPFESFNSQDSLLPNLSSGGKVIVVVSPSFTWLFGRSNVPLIRNVSHCPTASVRGAPFLSVILKEVITSSTAENGAMVGALDCFSEVCKVSDLRSDCTSVFCKSVDSTDPLDVVVDVSL